MKIKKHLLEKRKGIVDKWFESIVNSYPSETGKYFIEKGKQFSNPVGYTLSEEINHLFDDLCEGKLTKKADQALENILKIRAVQDFTPSQAVSFMFQLKEIVRNTCSEYKNDKDFLSEIVNFELLCDQAAMRAFDTYMQARELMYQIKANEVRKRNSRMVERLNRKYDKLDDEIDDI